MIAAMTQLASPVRTPRTAVMFTADIGVTGGDAVRCRVLNLSESGICIAAANNLSRGAAVTVSIGQVIRAPAQVVWVRGGIAGISFLEAIDVHSARQRGPVMQRGPTRAGWLAALHHPAAR